MKQLVKCCGPLKLLQLEILNAKVLQQCQRCLTFVWFILTGCVCRSQACDLFVSLIEKTDSLVWLLAKPGPEAHAFGGR